MDKDNLKQLLNCITKNHIYIQPHNYPDPDALASARGLQVLLSHYKISSTICFSGHVDKQNTLKMIDFLHIDIHPVETISLREEDEIILVDCQKGNANVKNFIGNEIACIDHHKIQDTDCYRFFDIRDAGSCSSLIADYFFNNNIPMDTELATTLLYGLKMDTANLTRGVSNLDIDVFSSLYKQSSHDILMKLDSNNITLRDLSAYTNGIKNLSITNRIGFANLGYNLSDAIIGTLADFLLTLSEIDFIVTYSLREDGIKFSVRSGLETYNCALIIKKVLKDFGDGGGHAHMAAGFVPVSKEMADIVISQIQNRFINEITCPLSTV